MTLKKTNSYYCPSCCAVETIPPNQDGIKDNQLVNVICPVCLAKGHKHKMYKLLMECGK